MPSGLQFLYLRGALRAASASHCRYPWDRDAPIPIPTNSNSWNWSELDGIGIGIAWNWNWNWLELELVGISRKCSELTWEYPLLSIYYIMGVPKSHYVLCNGGTQKSLSTI